MDMKILNKFTSHISFPKKAGRHPIPKWERKPNKEATTGNRKSTSGKRQ
jgi:hypothetical protein